MFCAIFTLFFASFPVFFPSFLHSNPFFFLVLTKNFFAGAI